MLGRATRLAAEMARALPRGVELKTFATMDPLRCLDFKRHVKSSP
ncbi:MAG TPA: hypothetical protein VFQ53_19260 [Kofleriaceae bacterium]|nr:hypothetical protein [Kofleriaceae bacterium]